MTVDEVKQKTTHVFQEFGVSHAAVFGSVARGEDRPGSDVDLLIRLGRPTGMVGYMRLIESLENCLERKVDLVTEQSLNQHLAPHIARDLTDIYEG